MRHSPYPVTLRQLQYVVAVAEARSFRRAAEACAVSQPSLSAQLAEAERALGVRLFERDRRGVLVTGAGAVLLERARRLLLDADDLLEAARRHADPLAGTLRLGILPTVGPYLLPGGAPAVRAALPKLQVLWEEDRTAALVRKVAAGALEGALVAREADLGDLVHVELAADPFVLAAPPDHPLARDLGPLEVRALRGERVLLLDDGHCLREQALEVCARGRAEEAGYRATSLPTLVQMVAGGGGVTLLPRIAVETEAPRAGLVVRPFAAPVPRRTLVLAWRRGAAAEPALRAVAEALRARLAAGRPPGGRPGGRGPAPASGADAGRARR
jgi:LysR family hydrogen peroxide-inducible transcriptional activator